MKLRIKMSLQQGGTILFLMTITVLILFFTQRNALLKTLETKTDFKIKQLSTSLAGPLFGYDFETAIAILDIELTDPDIFAVFYHSPVEENFGYNASANYPGYNNYHFNDCHYLSDCHFSVESN